VSDVQQTEYEQVSVLLVDDEENILRSIQRLLMDEEGIEITIATSGEEGLKLIPDLANLGLIVSDQRMPGMNGAQFLAKACEISPDASRIILTGYADVTAAVDAINKGGAWRYLAKPWNDVELVQVIREGLGRYRTTIEKRRFNALALKQNLELEEWNRSLKQRVLQTAATIREQKQVIKTLDKTPIDLISRTFDAFFEMAGDRDAVHARTVSAMVTDVARKIGLDAESVTTFRAAALLHDIGKFGCSEAGQHSRIEEMSESEFKVYSEHPLRGEKIISRVEELAAILPIIRGHHEAWDGSGFPDGLSGESIPLGARLIAIADFIEKSARSVDKNRADQAILTTKYHAGTLLDPQLISKFNGITRIIYFEGKKWGTVMEVELDPHDLVPGMIVARDVNSSSDVLLMQAGTILDISTVALIQSTYRKNKPEHGIYIKFIED
jgi:response regulator RpfG family c-di-GMP phosphodiesterase